MKSEKAIQNEVLLDVTALPDVMAWRENSGLAWVGNEMRVGVGQMVRVQSNMKILLDPRPLRAGVPGIADIMGVAGGRAVALEVKDWQGTQRIEQSRFQAAFEKAGGAYSIVRGRDEAVQFLRETVLK